MSDLQKTKEARSRLKARISSTAKQLQHPSGNTEELIKTLQSLYSEFLETHYYYCELVNSSDEHDDYKTVGGLDLDQYLKCVQDTYASSINNYKQQKFCTLSNIIDIVLDKANFVTPQLISETEPASSFVIDEAESILYDASQLIKELSILNVEGSKELNEKLTKCIRDLNNNIFQAKHMQTKSTRAIPINPTGNDNTFTPTSSQSNPATTSAGTPLRASRDLAHDVLAGAAGAKSAQSTSTKFSDLSIVSAYDRKFFSQSIIGDNLTTGNSGSNVNVTNNATNQCTHKSKFKKSPPPTFDGNRKQWVEFRTVWRNYASLEYGTDEERAWALKGALKGKALELVKAVFVTQPQAYDRMWHRLESVYSDISLSVQSAYEDLKQIKPVRENDLKGLVSFANNIEMCYSQLGEVDQLNAITMTHIDELTDLLPLSVRKAWMKVYSGLSTEDKVHPFSPFMKFLEDERDVSARLSERGTVASKSEANGRLKSSTFHSHSTQSTDKVTDHVSNSSVTNVCLFHNKAGTTHNTSQCNKFKALSIPEKLLLLKRNHACFKCFGKHLRSDCKSTISCSICGKDSHHMLLCKDLDNSSNNKSNSTNTTVSSVNVSNVSNVQSVNSVTLSNKSDLSNTTEACVLSPYPSVDHVQSFNLFRNKCDTPQTNSPYVDVSSFQGSYAGVSGRNSVYPMQEVKVEGVNRTANVFFDSGSNTTFITDDAARTLRARRLSKVNMELTTMGNNEVQLTSWLYEISLVTVSGSSVLVKAYGIKEIMNQVASLDLNVIGNLFPDFEVEQLQRKNKVDMLIGVDYGGLHPKTEVARAEPNLSIMEGVLGLCLMGSHRNLIGSGTNFTAHVELKTQTQVTSREASHQEFSKPCGVDNFILGEELGMEVNPRCGGCKCTKCPIVGHTFSFREEQELQLIRQNLTYNKEDQRWSTKYPWIVDPSKLPDNYKSALATLRSTEARLKRDPEWALKYQDQIEDMITRQVARKLSTEELNEWVGPKFYISHLAVFNPKSSSTPVRIVFNSSQTFQGVSLNSFLAKGPDSYLNNLLGILLRWREEKVVIIGDIKKMYNSILIEETEQHCHRFLWRNLEDRPPDVYIILRVNMGDRPAAAISTEAIYKTAELFKNEFPQVAELLRRSTYVDDIVDSVPSDQVARQLTKDTGEVLQRAGFRIKEWVVSGELDEDQEVSVQRVLGVHWQSREDVICFKPTLNFSRKKHGVYTEPDLTKEEVTSSVPAILTRRMVLEQTMKIYDPLGILSPFTLKAKILLRQTWSMKLKWDDQLPDSLRYEWIQFFQEVFHIGEHKYDRCLTPMNVTGDPVLIMLSDASDVAYGFSAYIRWELTNGEFWCRLVMAKCKIAPLQRLSTPQMELNAAVLSKRGRKVLDRELRIKFRRVYHLVDSETVLHMINKMSTRFKLYEGIRIGEIQAATGGDLSEWFWIPGTDNTADCLTRSKCPQEISPHSEWWRGPSFLYNPEHQWNIRTFQQCSTSSSPLPGEKKLATSMVIQGQDSPFLSYTRYSSAKKLIWTIARIVSSFKFKSFKGGHTENVSVECFNKAKEIIIKDVQKVMEGIGSRTSKYAKLKPFLDQRGIWVVGSRLQRYNPMAAVPSQSQVLLPAGHWLTHLFLREAHIKSGHRGRDVTVARFRQEFWTPQATKQARTIRNHCQECRLKDAQMLSQEMGKLPEERLKPSPPFCNTMVDLFGPYHIRGEVQKRITAKAYGVIFTDICSRAVHIEAVLGYDTSSFLMALTRFVCVRGWPQKFFSDPGTQLIGADKELTEMWRGMDKSSIYKQSLENGSQWIFSPANSPWYQGAVEVLIKAVKRCFKFAFSCHKVSITEFLTICAQTTNMLNERPLGILGDSEDCISVLTPNCLLIGRPYAQNPGQWSDDRNINSRLKLTETISQVFWRKWTELYAPTLIRQQKWHKGEYNLKKGDIVVVTDSNSLRGQYYIAKVQEVFPDVNGKVRRVSLMYRNFKVGDKFNEYKCSKPITITRSVHRLALLAPASADTDCA